MAPLLAVDTDTAELLAALETLGDEAESYVKVSAKVTADRIADEARGRVRRATGATAAGIGVEETHDGKGWVVFTARPDNPGLPGWIEHGTKYMPARGFLFVSARLEEGPHLRRTTEALQNAIDAKGLGE
jgi:hypothetical protein